MKHIVLTSIAVLAFAACSDTPETTLDEAYQGGSDEAVELVETTPADAAPEVESELVETEALPENADSLIADPLNEIDPSGVVEETVETAAPADDGALGESDLSSPEVVSGDNQSSAIDAVLPETDGGVEVLEDVKESIEEPQTDELIDDATEMLEEKADEVVEDLENTETPQ